MTITAIPPILPVKVLGAKIALQEMIDSIRDRFEREGQAIPAHWPDDVRIRCVVELHRDYQRTVEPLVRRLIDLTSPFVPSYIVTGDDIEKTGIAT